MNIIKGKKSEAVKAVIYGPEGTGKSTLASLLPSPIFLDVEGSTGTLDVARTEPKTVAEILAALTEIRTKHANEFRSVIIDTADWVEAIYIEEMCKAQRKASIAECSGGYGKGYVELGRKFADFLDACDAVSATGLHVVILAHCKTVKVSPPDQVEGFTRFQLKLNEEHVAAKLKEWAHMVLFVRRDVQLVKGKDDRIKGSTTAAEHVIQTSYAPAWDAKNRHDLPEQLAYAKGVLPAELAAVFNGGLSKVAHKVVEVEGESVKPAPATPEQQAKIEQYKAVSVCAAVIAKAFDHYKVLDASELDKDQAGKIITRCQQVMNEEAAK